MKRKQNWIGAGIVTVLCVTGWTIGETLTYPIQRLKDAGPVAGVTEDGRRFVSVGQGSQAGEPGAPMLPAATYRLLIPADAQEVSATLANPVWETPEGSWEIDAVPPAATGDGSRVIVDWGKADPARIRQGRDLSIYESDTDYPAEPMRLESVGELSGYKIAEVQIVWAVYNPVQKTVRVLQSGTIQIRYMRRDGLVPPPSPTRVGLLDALADLIDNPQDIEAFYPAIEPPTAKDSFPPPPATFNYVIITTEYILQNSKQLPCFIALKQMQGFSVKVVTEATASDETHYAGGSHAEERADNIRQWLRSRYLSQGFQYVLLVGNPHPLNLTARSVPMRWCRARANLQYAAVPTDMYFAELSNTWDKDGDGLIGEFSGDYGSGGADKTCELKVGRIPDFNTINELDQMLSGTMDYIVDATDQSWRRKLLIAAAVSNFSPQDNNGDGDASDFDDIDTGRTFGDGWGESLKNKAEDLSYYAYTLYEKSGCKTDGSAYTTKACKAPLTVDNLVDEWEHGYGFVSWWGHGNNGGAYRMIWQQDDYHTGICNEPTEADWRPFFDRGHCDELNGYRRSFVAEVSCLNGQPNGSNLASSLLTYGSVGAFAGTSVTWYKIGGWGTGDGESYGDNASYGYYLFRRMAEYGDTAGAALNWCRSHFGTGWSDGSSWMNMLAFTLHGDPSLSLSTSYPNLAPLAPIDLQARHVGEQIHLTWGDNSRNETGFKIQYKYDPQIWPYSWYDLVTVPENTTSFQYTFLQTGMKYYFRVCAYNDSGDSDYTETVEITPMMELKTIGITSPNGGETLVSGQIHTIRWTNYNNPAAQVTIHLSTDGGSTWKEPPIEKDWSNSGTSKTLDWIVPNVNSTRCVLRVADASDGWPYDLSNEFFAITPLPDLVIESISLDPPQPMLGQPCTVKITVHNQGMANSGSFWTNWYANRTTPPQPEDPWDLSEVHTLAAGKRVTTSKTFTFNFSGPIQMYAAVDPDDLVHESDENNNLLGPAAAVVIDFEVLFDEANALGWFGGDDREGFKPRNVGAGQQIQLGRTSHVTQVAFRFNGKFDYHQDPTGYGHDATLVLDIRDGEGDSVQRVFKTVDAEFRGGWIDFNLDQELWAGLPYTFTCYLQDGQANELFNGITGYAADHYSNTQGFSAVGTTGNAQMDDWSTWQEHPWEYNFHLCGYRTDRMCGDLNGDHVVSLSDLRRFAENWLKTDCTGPQSCGSGDCDDNGRVDTGDFAMLAADYGRSLYAWSYWQRFTIGNREAVMSTAAISGSNGSEFWPDTIFIYKTNAGRFGQLRVQAYDPLTKQLTIEWITYNDNGTPYSSGQGLAIGASYTCDLDAGVVPGGTGGDWHWNLINETTRYLLPRNSAKFLMVFRPATQY